MPPQDLKAIFRPDLLVDLEDAAPVHDGVGQRPGEAQDEHEDAGDRLSEGHGYEAVEAALNKLGLGDIGEETDVELMQKVLFDIGFGGFRMAGNDEINHILGRLENSPIPLATFRSDIIKGLAQNIPVARTIVRVANELDLGDLEASLAGNRQIKHAVHMMVVLEVFTTLMIHDSSFERAMAMHILDQRGVRNKGNMVENFIKIYRDKRDMFAALKLCSVDPAIWYSMCWRQHGGNPTPEQVEAFIAEHELTGVNASILRSGLDKEASNHNRGLSSNIMEAVVSQPLRQHGGEENSMAGFAMVPFLEQHSKYTTSACTKGKPRIDSDALRASGDSQEDDFWKRLYEYEGDNNVYPDKEGMPDTFKHLYGAWNLAFVMSQLPGLNQFVIPKLIMPHMLLAEGKDYIYSRTVSLWLAVNAINIATRREDEGTSKLPATYATPPHLEKVIEIFGKENLQYAKEHLLTGLDGFDAEQLEACYRENFGERGPGQDEAGISDWVSLGLSLTAKLQGHDFSEDGPWSNFYTSWMKQNPGKTAAGVTGGLAAGGLVAAGLMAGGVQALLPILAAAGLTYAGVKHLAPRPKHPFGKLPDENE